MSKAYQIAEDREGHKCEVCGSPTIDHSHSFPRRFISVRENPLNIRILCRKHHQDFENNNWASLGDAGPVILADMGRLVIAQENPVIRDSMMGFLMSKIVKSQDKPDAPQYIIEFI